MRYRSLGPFAVSEIGFGGWAIGGDSYGRVSGRQARAALTRASELGINFFDTADIYGMGHSEGLLGSHASGQRDQVVLSTKGGYTNYSLKVQDFSRSHLLAALDASLRRLGTSHADVFSLHSPPRSVLEMDEAFEVLRGLQESGKIRLRGVSVRSTSDALFLLQEAEKIDVIQVAFNLVQPQAADLGLFAQARQKGIGIVVRAPLCFGLLSGKYSQPAFGRDDHRARIPKEELQAWINLAERVKFLEANGSRTLAQAALQFALQQDGVSVAIPGIKTARQAEENIAASEVPPLNTGELAQIHFARSDGDLESQPIKVPL